MSKLTRVIQRVFGETGTTTEFGQFGSEAASPPGTTTKDLTVIQSLSQYLLGWYSATANASEPPRIQDRNALDLLITSQLKYLFQNGIAEWLNDVDQRYYAGVSFVNRSGVIYIAILGDDVGNINTGKDPLTETTWWTPILKALEDAEVLNTAHRTSDGKNHSDVVLNNTHRSSDGSDHGFIDQDVKSTASPTFNNVTFNGTILPATTQSDGSWALTTTPMTIPRGFYSIRFPTGSSVWAEVEQYSTVLSSWVLIARGYHNSVNSTSAFGVFVGSDGSNYRIKTNTGTTTVHWRKL